MIFGIFLFIIFAFALDEKIWFIHWPATDFLNSIIFAITYFIGSCWLAANITYGDADTAAVIFGFITVIVYGFSTWLTFLLLREWYYNWQARRGQPRQVVTTTTTVVHVQWRVTLWSLNLSTVFGVRKLIDTCRRWRILNIGVPVPICRSASILSVVWSYFLIKAIFQIISYSGWKTILELIPHNFKSVYPITWLQVRISV